MYVENHILPKIKSISLGAAVMNDRRQKDRAKPDYPILKDADSSLKLSLSLKVRCRSGFFFGH